VIEQLRCSTHSNAAGCDDSLSASRQRPKRNRKIESMDFGGTDMPYCSSRQLLYALATVQRPSARLNIKANRF
jgi:hypothetical protein